VCKILHGEMARRSYNKGNFVKLLNKLKEELAKGCVDYKEG